MAEYGRTMAEYGRTLAEYGRTPGRIWQNPGRIWQNPGRIRQTIYLVPLQLLRIMDGKASYFTCHVHKERDLRETRIYIINTALKNINYPTTNTAYVL